MKVSFFSRVQFSATALFLISTLSLFSQKVNTWKGGAPGMEHEWFCPKNWSAGTIPNEFSNVFIPDVTTTTQATPVIQSGKVEINTLILQTNAVLTIGPAAELVIQETAEGIDPTTVVLKGKILLPEGPQNRKQSKLAKAQVNKIKK